MAICIHRAYVALTRGTVNMAICIHRAYVQMGYMYWRRQTAHASDRSRSSSVTVSVTVPLWWSPGSRHNPGLFLVIIAILYSWLHGNVQDVEVFLSARGFS